MPNIQKKMFYIPFLYFINTRSKNIVKSLSWVCIYIIPILLFLMIYKFEFFSIADFYKFLLSLILVYTLYEIGYIYNDTETIKHEKKPTIRLNSEQFVFYETNKTNIYACRCILAVLLTAIIIVMGSPVLLALLPWAIIFVYTLYNYFRSRINLLLHFILVVLRYGSPLLIVLGFDSNVILITIFIFPMINLLERCGEKRFDLVFFQSKWFKKHNYLRVFYYFICTLIGSLCYLLYGGVTLRTFMLISIYYLLYRSLSAVYINKQG